MIKKPLIKCPHCGREYLACEVFYPNDFLGKAYNVVRNENEIIAYEGHDMDTTETYTCDACNTQFKVEAVINFKTEEVKDLFSDDDF